MGSLCIRRVACLQIADQEFPTRLTSCCIDGAAAHTPAVSPPWEYRHDL
jgi:hypothetical protein